VTRIYVVFAAGFPLLKAIVSELVKFGELSNSQPPSPKVTSTPIKSAATFSASRIKEVFSCSCWSKT